MKAMKIVNGNLELKKETQPVVLRSPRYKRVFDITIILISHIVLLPIWLFVWFVISLAIWLEDRGPIFFEDVRIGQYGRRFKIYKFRTMIVNADEIGPKQAAEKDGRITKVGKIIRALALDELPQLINILKGEMSFIGPRALRAYEIELNSDFRKIEDVPGYWLRTQVRPGLTGIAQVYAPRDISRKNKFRYDAIYVKNMSLWLDVRLLLLSLWITLKGKWESRERKFDMRVIRKFIEIMRAKKKEPIVRKPIGQILLESGVITEGQLNEGLEYQKMHGGKLGENLVRKRYISEGTLKYFLDKQLAMNGGQYQLS